jgi:hypothetical protein
MSFELNSLKLAWQRAWVPDRYDLVLSYFNIGDSKKSEGLRARVAVRGEPERRGVNPVPGTNGLNRPSTGVPGDSSLDRRNDLNTYLLRYG